MNEEEITVKLTENEAWVLYDFVNRYSETEELNIKDQAEQRALWNLCCVFEKTLTMPLEEDSYVKFIEKCKEKLRDET